MMPPLNALILSLPTRNSTTRMRVWRALKETGCGVLRDGVYVLPSGSAGVALLAEVEKDIKSAGGFAMTLELQLKTDEQLAHVRKLFDRSVDYGALVRKIKEAKASFERLGPRKAGTAVSRLQRSFDKLSAMDFFPGPATRQAAEAISALKRDFQQTYPRGEPRPSRRRLKPANRAKYQKRIWATRKDPWVDRLATAWLIKRFVDPAARQAADAVAALKRDFQQTYPRGEPRPSRRRLKPVNRAKYQKRIWATRKDPWVDRLATAWLIKRCVDPAARFVWIDRPSERPRGAIGFDFDGAQFTHVKNRVTFEVVLESLGLDKDPALVSIGAAVHFLDIGGIPVADARGLETVLRGIKEKTRSDDALLSEAMRIFDLFYSAYGRA